MLQADDGRFAEFEHAMIARNVRFRDAVAEISPLPTDRDTPDNAGNRPTQIHTNELTSQTLGRAALTAPDAR